MDSKAQGQRYTKQKEPEPAPRPKKTQHEMFIKVVDLKETMYSYQTGNLRTFQTMA